MAFSIIFVFLLVFVLLIGLVFLVVLSLRKGTSGIKIMLFGLNLTLIGGIVAVDPNSNLNGIEYLIALAGLIISAIGLRKND